MEGTKITNPIPGIAVCCISEDARSLLDQMVEEYEKHYNDLKDVHPDPVTPDRAYGIFYWLCRYSGLVEGVNKKFKLDGLPCKKVIGCEFIEQWCSAGQCDFFTPTT